MTPAPRRSSATIAPPSSDPAAAAPFDWGRCVNPIPPVTAGSSIEICCDESVELPDDTLPNTPLAPVRPAAPAARRWPWAAAGGAAVVAAGVWVGVTLIPIGAKPRPAVAAATPAPPKAADPVPPAPKPDAKPVVTKPQATTPNPVRPATKPAENPPRKDTPSPQLKAPSARPAAENLAATAPAARPRQIHIDTIKESVGVVKGRNVLKGEERIVGLGSCFVVAPGVVATNCHVISLFMPEHLAVVFPSARDPNPAPLAVRILYANRDADLALLAVETDRRPLALADEAELNPGLPVAVVGNPAGVRELNAVKINEVTRGRYLGAIERNLKEDAPNVRDVAMRGTFLRTDADAAPGNSGGPVLSERSAAVVGVLQGEQAVGPNEANRVFVPGRVVKAAVAGLGPRAGWATKADAVTARHLYALAARLLVPKPDEGPQFDTMGNNVIIACQAVLRGRRPNQRLSPDSPETPVSVVAASCAQMDGRLKLAKPVVTATLRLGTHLSGVDKNRLTELLKVCEEMHNRAEWGRQHVSELPQLPDRMRHWVKRYRELSAKVCQSLDDHARP